MVSKNPCGTGAMQKERKHTEGEAQANCRKNGNAESRRFTTEGGKGGVMRDASGGLGKMRIVAPQLR